MWRDGKGEIRETEYDQTSKQVAVDMAMTGGGTERGELLMGKVVDRNIASSLNRNK